MALKEISKPNLRKELIVPGTTIRKYVTSTRKEWVNPDYIIQILMDFGIDAGGEKIHKIIFHDNRSIFVSQAGLGELDLV